MAKHKVEDIRNVALVGHGAAGKTTLADALLFHAKAVERKGSVDDGSSVSDFDDEEQKRKFSIGKGCVLFNAPDDVGAKFTEVLSVLHPPASVPPDCPVDLAATRAELIGAAVESDETLAEKFLMEEPISDEELIGVLPKALAA